MASRRSLRTMTVATMIAWPSLLVAAAPTADASTAMTAVTSRHRGHAIAARAPACLLCRLARPVTREAKIRSLLEQPGHGTTIFEVDSGSALRQYQLSADGGVESSVLEKSESGATPLLAQPVVALTLDSWTRNPDHFLQVAKERARSAKPTQIIDVWSEQSYHLTVSDEGDVRYGVAPGLEYALGVDVEGVFRSLNTAMPNPQNIEIITFFDSSRPPLLAKFDEIGVKHTRYDEVSEPQSYFSARPDKLIIIVGHREGDNLVVLGGDGQPLVDTQGRAVSFSVHELEDYARSSGSFTLVLSCDGGRTSSGPMGTVIAENLAAQLKVAVIRHNYNDFLAALGTSDNPMVVRSETGDFAKRVVEAERATLKKEMKRSPVLAASLSGPPGRSSDWRDIVIGYGTLILATLAFARRTSWRVWLRIMGPLRKDRSGSPIASFENLLLLVAYALLAPILFVAGAFRILRGDAKRNRGRRSSPLTQRAGQ